MSQAVTPTHASPQFVTVADVISSVGDIPTNRIRIHPAPGTATETDVVRANEDAMRTAICELIDGTLVEKTMGSYESLLALLIASNLNQFVLANGLGIVLGADGMLRLAPGLIRVPDVSFISWKQLPDKKLPSEPVWTLHPDLAVEVLSPSNTPAEMERKLQHYFTTGARQVWHLSPREKLMHVFHSPDESNTIDIDGTLEGGDVLPGFSLLMTDIFQIESSSE